MKEIDPDIVIDAVKRSLGRMTKAENGNPSIPLDQNLFDLVGPDAFAQLIRELEASLDVTQPMDQVDVTSIVHIDRLIVFICEHG